MALRQTDEEQAVFDHALELVAEQGPMSTEEVDSLSMLEADDLAKFHDVWAKLPAGARARLLVALHGAAQNRLRLDFSALNQMALDDADPQVRLGGLGSSSGDQRPKLLRHAVECGQS